MLRKCSEKCRKCFSYCFECLTKRNGKQHLKYSGLKIIDEKTEPHTAENDCCNGTYVKVKKSVEKVLFLSAASV